MRQFPVRFLTLLLIAGCHDAPAVTEPDETAPLLVISGVMSPQHQAIAISAGNIPITNASVTVNGYPIRYDGNLYSGNLPVAVRAGDMLRLKVVSRGVTFEAEGETSSIPTITAPTPGSTFAATDSIRLVWSSRADPDRFSVCLNCDTWDYAGFSAPGSERELKIGPNTLVDYGQGAVVAVTAFESDFLNAPDSPGVYSNVRFEAKSEAIITIKY